MNLASDKVVLRVEVEHYLDNSPTEVDQGSTVVVLVVLFSHLVLGPLTNNYERGRK